MNATFSFLEVNLGKKTTYSKAHGSKLNFNSRTEDANIAESFAKGCNISF